MKKYDLAINYYMAAIHNGNINAIIDLARLYFKLKKYDLSKKFYLISAPKYDNSIGMFGAALIYDHVDKNYTMAEKLYLQAINKGSVKAMYKLAN